MQNKQAEQNLYETAGAEQTELSERSETRSSVNRFAYMSAEAPALRGELRGSADHPTAEGSIFAYWLDGALYLQAELLGLPPDRVFGFHIHDGIICGSPDSGGASGAFDDAGPHLSLCPEGTWCGRHPYHAGNLPPIFSDSDGYAAMEVYIGKALISDYSGKPIILHDMPDDFSTQPSGGSGKRIACGIFTEVL